MGIRTYVLTVLCIGVLSTPAFAMSNNHRATSSSLPQTDEQGLQDILNSLVVAGPPIDASSPSGFELFDAGSTGITAQVITAVGGSFGIYDGDDPNNRATLLHGNWPTSFVSTISFSDDGRITFPKVSGWPSQKKKALKAYSRGGSWKLDTRSGFDGPFGFFMNTKQPGGPVYIFTQDALNGGEQRALVFQGNGETTIQLPGLRAGIFRPDQFILAFDADGDGEFGDMVVAISGAVGVPEPATALLIGFSLLGLARLRRT